MSHTCVDKLIIIASDNSFSPGRRQAIIWINAGVLSTWPLRTNINEILIEIYTFSFMKMHLKMSSVKWRPFYIGINVLTLNEYMNWNSHTKNANKISCMSVVIRSIYVYIYIHIYTNFFQFGITNWRFEWDRISKPHRSFWSWQNAVTVKTSV